MKGPIWVQLVVQHLILKHLGEAKHQQEMPGLENTIETDIVIAMV